MHASRLTRPSLSLLCLACLAGFACGDPAVPRTDTAPPSRPVPAPEPPGEDAVRLARLPDSREGDAAALPGVLHAENGCLYVEARDGTLYLIGSMMPGAHWDAADEALVVPGPEGAEAGRFALGAPVTLGGSEARPGVLDAAWVDPPGDACDTTHVWVTASLSTDPP